MKIVIDKQAKSNECDKQGCRNKAVKYCLLSAGAVHLCRKHAQQLYAVDAALPPSAEADSSLVIVPAVEFDTQPRT